MPGTFPKNSYPAKLILFGEHTVLRNGICIALAINKTGCIKEGPIYGILAKDKSAHMVDLSYLCNKHNRIEIHLNVEFGTGLGSSAIISLLLAENNIDRIKEKDHYGANEILTIAQRIEDLFHGRSSGVDVTTSFVGGLISYKNYIYEKITYSHLSKFKILIHDSKIKKFTQKILGEYDNKDVYEDIYEKIIDVTIQANELIRKEFTLKEIHALMRLNQDYLDQLGVVPEIMKFEVEKLRKLGIESKITGGGCGGHLYTIVEKDVELDNWVEVDIFDKEFTELN